MILPLPASMETSILEVVIFTGFLYWLCPSFINSLLERLARMVDIVTSRMFESFNRFSPNQTCQTESLSTISNMKRFSQDNRSKRAISREADIKIRENQLFDAKENTNDLQMSRPKSILRLACQNCSMTSRESLVNKTTDRMALRNMFIRPLPGNSFISRYMSDVYYNWKMKPFSYVLPSDDCILENERVKMSIEHMTREQLEDAENKKSLYESLLVNNRQRAKKLLKDLKSAINVYVMRCSNWFFHKMFPLFLNSVLVHPGQINMIKEASKSGLPLIFLPLHRSHLDYLLLTYITYNNGIKCPIVAAGDNLRLPFFGQVLRGLGAFYIKRRMDPIEGRKDHIYRAILHTYMNSSLKNGNNIEFYIEGGRTRTGKPLMPKCGIFSVIVDSLMDGTIDDALLVPVSMNYDKLVDGNFIREQLGKPKKMESVLSTIKSLWKSINGDYGMVKVDFNQPCSLRELVKSFKSSSESGMCEKKILSSTASTSSIYGTAVLPSANKNIIENISRHIVYDATRSTSVMATNAVAFLLLTKYRKGGFLEEIAESLDILRADLDYSKKELSFQGNSIDVINYAVEMLGPALVRKEITNKRKFIKPQVELPNCIELSYYSNTLVPHYALDSVIALAIKYVDNDSGFIDSDYLMESAHELCSILQYEFIFCKPCQSIDQTIRYYLDDLVLRKQIFLPENETALEAKSRRMAQEFDEDNEGNAYVSYKYRFNRDSSVHDYLQFYRAVVHPLLECYAVSAQTLKHIANKSVLETELVKDILDNLQMQLLNKSVLYSEAVSTDAIKNALKLFVTWGILEFHNEGKLRMYHFKKGEDSIKVVEDVYARINKYRPVDV